MKNSLLTFRLGGLAALTTGLALAVSCSQSAPVPPPAAPPSEVGRFQVVVAAEGERGTALFLVDTKEGKTWFYRPPQGPLLVNGFWSDIPQVTYPNEYWRQVFNQMAAMQQAPQGSATNRAPVAVETNAPAPSATTR